MTPDTNFESMFVNSFSTMKGFVDNDHDPDANFYHVSVLDAQYLSPDNFKTNFKDFSKNSFSILNLNIVSIKKISNLSVNFIRN